MTVARLNVIGARAAISVLCGWVSFGPCVAIADDGLASAALALVRQMALAVQGASADPHGAGETRDAAFRDLIDRHFDLAALARSALGPAWDRAPRPLRARFVDAYRAHIARACARRFTSYRDHEFRVLGARRGVGGTARVVTRVRGPDGAARDIDWIVADGVEPRVRDLVFDGVSLNSLRREEFAVFLSRHQGRLEDLIAKLERPPPDPAGRTR